MRAGRSSAVPAPVTPAHDQRRGAAGRSSRRVRIGRLLCRGPKETMKQADDELSAQLAPPHIHDHGKRRNEHPVPRRDRSTSVRLPNAFALWSAPRPAAWVEREIGTNNGLSRAALKIIRTACAYFPPAAALTTKRSSKVFARSMVVALSSGSNSTRMACALFHTTDGSDTGMRRDRLRTLHR